MSKASGFIALLAGAGIAVCVPRAAPTRRAHHRTQRAAHDWAAQALPPCAKAPLPKSISGRRHRRRRQWSCLSARMSRRFGSRSFGRSRARPRAIAMR